MHPADRSAVVVKLLTGSPEPCTISIAYDIHESRVFSRFAKNNLARHFRLAAANESHLGPAIRCFDFASLPRRTRRRFVRPLVILNAA